MDNWTCGICHEELPVEDIVTGNHMRLMHPDVDTGPAERWPDGDVVYFEDPDEDPGTFI